MRRLMAMIERLHGLVPLDEMAIGARLLWSLPGFLRRPISAAERIQSSRVLRPTNRSPRE
jgi:hypothetical protein